MDWRAWPPRLPEQPIFYPILDEDYAVRIARDWNVKHDGAGFVTRFEVESEFLRRYPVQQAGGRTILMPPELERGIAGHEQQFATNYLGHFALALGLHRALAAADGARLVSVSSSGHLYSPVVFDDIDFRFRPYDALVAYGQSKTADILLAVEAQRRWSGDGITANSLHPGAIATNLQRHTGGLRTPEPFRKTIEQGAATSVFLAAHPGVEGVGGRYFEDVNEAPVVHARPTEYGAPGVAAYALDPDNAVRLWELADGIVR
ncbi:hypothetical protein ACWGQ5_36065 [Streptomyces sp. NPDC055722]